MKKLPFLLLALVFFCLSAARAGSIYSEELIDAVQGGKTPAEDVSDDAPAGALRNMHILSGV